VLTSCAWRPSRAVAQCEGIPAPLDFVSPEQTSIVEAPLPTILLVPFDDPARAEEGAVGVEGCGRFMIAWGVEGYPRDEDSNHDNSIAIQRVLPNGVLDGGVEFLTKNAPFDPENGVFSDGQPHLNPSVAVSPAGNVRVSWIASCFRCRTNEPPVQDNVMGEALRADFTFDEAPAITPAPFPEPVDFDHRDVSAGTSDGVVARMSWSSQGEGLTGIRQGDSVATADLDPISPCGVTCFVDNWQANMAMRPNGDFCIAWAEAETPDQVASKFNIGLRLYDNTGTLINEIAGPNGDNWVNDPSLEPFLTDQVSPGLAFDAQGNIVVAWVGLDLNLAPRIFARRFHWAGGASDEIVPLSAPFIVDNDETAGVRPKNLLDPNPTVAFVQDSEEEFPAANPGRFVVAWNSLAPNVDSELHAQYFDADGRPMGREFRVNVDATPTGQNGLTLRKMAESGRHTVAYGGAGHAMFTWQSCGGFAPNTCEAGFSHYTVLPVGFAEHQDALNPCCKGDADGNGLVDGRDIQSFVDLLLAPPAVIDIVAMCPFDMNDDAALTIDDAA
jgi:hypothetical protein